jgi:glyoxylase-like metal-dependent hydrolase (beta-lactamase superfamily II)
MKWHRVFVACVFIALGTVARAQEGTVKQVVPGVWFREGETRPGTRVILCANSTIIEMADYLVAVDANFPSCGEKVIAAAKELSPKPIKYVIDTHHHRDHAYGNPVFTKIGATTLAHAGVVDEMNRSEPKAWLHEAQVRPDVAGLHLPTPERPRQTYTKSPFVLSDSTRRVELLNFGWGHTRGDTFVYLPKERVLCTGDVVVNGPYITTRDADNKNWPNVIRQAQKLKVKYVLPGHGPVGNADTLEGMKQFLVELYKAVDMAVKQGKTLDQLVTSKDGRPQSTSIGLPKSVEHFVSQQSWKLPTQVQDLYEEITQGKPHGEIAEGK